MPNTQNNRAGMRPQINFFVRHPKGGVENYNGLVRQYYPKGCDLRKVNQLAMDAVESEINDRPRKILGYKTAASHASKIAALCLGSPLEIIP